MWTQSCCFFIVHKLNFLLPGETCQSPLHRQVVLLWRNNEASVDTVKPGGCCCAAMLQTSGAEAGSAWWSDSMKVLCRPQPCHVTPQPQICTLLNTFSHYVQFAVWFDPVWAVSTRNMKNYCKMRMHLSFFPPQIVSLRDSFWPTLM